MEQPLRLSRLILLFVVFWIIGFSLGYPTLNRYVPGDSPVSDAAYYADMVERGPAAVGEIGHWRYRVLVPGLAKPIHDLAKGHIGSWEPRYFALLVVNSAFCAASALIAFVLGRMVAGATMTAMVAALLLLCNFNTANYYLSGLVDSAEMFVLSATFLALATRRHIWLPAIGVLAGLSKESALVFQAALAGGWFLVEWRQDRPLLRGVLFAGVAVALGGAAILAIRIGLSGNFTSPLGVSGAPLGRPLLTILADIAVIPFSRAFLYTFAALGPLAAFGFRRLPGPWLGAAAAAFTTAFVVAGWAGLGDNLGRPLFSTAAPVLTVAASLGLAHLLGAAGDRT